MRANRPGPARHRRRAAGCALGLLAAAAQAQTAPAASDAQRVEITAPVLRDDPAVAASALRSSTPIEKTAQSVLVLSRTLIDDQQAQTLSQVLDNVSAVRGVDTRDLVNGGFKIRGFAAGVLVDGVALPGYFSSPESLAGVSRIEVVKGPAGTLFGGAQLAGAGAAGGLIALSTVAPEARASASAGLRVGSQGEHAASLDLNQPLGDSFGVRLVGEFGRADSETDFVTRRHLSVQPSLAWRPSRDSALVVRLRHGESRGRDDSGLPARGTVLPADHVVPRQRNLTASGLPDTVAQTDTLNLQWTQHLAAGWSYALTLSRVRAEVDQRGVFPYPFPAGAGQVLLLAGARLWDRFESTALSSSVSGQVDAGPLRHTLQAGLDLDNTHDDAFLRFSPHFGALGLIDVMQPVYPAWAEPDTRGAPDQRNRYRSAALYLQDQVELGALQLQASLRRTQVHVEDVNPASRLNNLSDNGKTLARAGAVLAVTPTLSAFAGWGQGMRVPTFAVFSEPPKPELSAQGEIGLRLTGLAGLSATLAWFDLGLKNAVVADPAHLGRSIQVGRQRSRGVDLDATWQLTPAWSWLGSVSRQNPKIEDTGRQIFDVPRTHLRVATRYEFGAGTPLPGLGLGLGLTRLGARPGDAANSFHTPAAALLDAQLSYRTDRLRLGLSVTNLADKASFLPSLYFGGGQVLPAPRRSLSASARVDF